MDRRLMTLAVAMVLVYVGPRATVVGVATPPQLEARLAPHLVTEPLPAGPGILDNSTCGGHGDVYYNTLDNRTFTYPSPVEKYGVMILPWIGNPWWVMTEHELHGAPNATRIKEVYVKCPTDIYFRATLGGRVNLYYWDGAAWVPIATAGLPANFPPPDGTAWVYGTPKYFKIDCNMAPYMFVTVYRHRVVIHAHGEWAVGGPYAVRGICADFNGNPGNDCVDLEAPPPLPAWKPFLI
ncbi:uncharacterized protein LOC106157867 [Lingula anatina]|uniref:Uncharacterized protein LOC106157867 n=1 Tax=Lingula anatina TaxID=7574 RepID=A0A1S3HU91_LINAN|nr:uncharacterized protein LOC106157867 [Lingula anatina]|eukprot:XP_013389111.1 uncharacterized protein LOC106157867 [Lingula anatina]